MPITLFAGAFLALAYVAWRRYLWAAETVPESQTDTCLYSLTDTFGDRHLANVPHQHGALWLTDIFARSAAKFPDLTALQIPHTGESLTFAELNAQAEKIAAALSPLLTGPDQVVAVAMTQDNADIVASHLGILKAGGTVVFLDTTLPKALLAHILDDAQPKIVLTRGEASFHQRPTLDVLALPDHHGRCKQPEWLDDPARQLAAIFYTSGTTGLPKGVECPHAGYVNLALNYADYFDLIPGMDATSLTSSLGYDGSISEMYGAWVSGCAVVLLTKEQVRSGPDLIPVLREAEVTVLFCPPVLLTTLTPNPDLDLPYPICRYIVPAGEAFPSALVQPWTRGRRQIINTYGPTEASTDTSRQSLRPGEPVTIGSPMANVTYVILDIGQLEPLPHGAIGELCIGGPHVARGYRNLAEQTAQKFIIHPRFGRLYRTGDRCKIDIHTQRVHFLGRIDSQLKVRGHRVETQAVEDLLQNQFTEIEAAVLDYQNDELIAFVSAPSLSGPDATAAVPAPETWAAQVTRSLAQQLPAPSIPSRLFLVKSFAMKPISGKIDRTQLPVLSNVLASATSVAQITTASHAETGSELAPGCDEILSICETVFETPMAWDSVFADNGGHSIVIAQLAQQLHAAGWDVTVRALLSDCDTARKIATHVQQYPRARARAPSTAVVDTSRAQRDGPSTKVLTAKVFTGLQLLFLWLLYLPALIGFLAIVGFAEIGEFFMTAHILEFVGLGFLMYLSALVLPFANLLWVMTIKLLMGGHLYTNKVAPGIYPKWSRMHLRVWCIGRLESSVISPLGMMFRSAPLMAYVLRRLGAKVGSNLQCAHDVEFSGPLDLLCVGDNIAIQTGAYIHTSKWLDQNLHIGPISLEDNCKIGMRAAIGPDVNIGHGAWINPFTPIQKDVGEQEMWEGAPAHCSGHCVDLARTATTCHSRLPNWLSEAFNIAMQVFLDFWLFVVPTAAVTWFAASFIPVTEAGVASEYFKVTPLTDIIWDMSLYTFITTWAAVLLISILVCLFLRCTPASPGIYSSRGLRGYLLLYRMKKMNQIQRQWTWTISGQYLRALAGMHFPRVGGSECDLMHNLVPELANADSQVFWSNGCFTNMLDHGAEHIKLCQLDMPRNFFSGTNSVAESGQFPSNFLLGASTLGNDIQFRRQMRSRGGEPITVAGNPPVQFASDTVDKDNGSQTLPSFSLFLARVFLNDLFSIGFLPMTGMLVYVILYTSLLRLDGQPMVSAFLALIFAEAIIILLCSAIKKLLVGSEWGTDHSTPFWSWRHFSYFFAQDCFFAWCKRPLRMTAGTLLSNTVLRRMGCQIGRRTIISAPMQASDWNAVNLGDDCMINGVLQFHTFENMILKVKRTAVHDGCSINLGSTIMGGAVIERAATILPLALILKEMYLPATGTYEGSPVEPAAQH